MMFPMAGFFARCRLFWLKGSCATRAPFTGCDRDSTRWSRSFWAWIGYRRSKLCGKKISDLCGQDGQAAQWQSRLAQEWMAGSQSDSVGLFYADGHVRVYHGSLTDLPRRYVARERLCLRGTTDYWINGLGGAPFFVLTQPINPGLIAVLRQSIVPRLLVEAPQPDAEALAADAFLPRLTLIFDREGYSPVFCRRTQSSTHRHFDLPQVSSRGLTPGQSGAFGPKAK
jgi:hypothetical protein